MKNKIKFSINENHLFARNRIKFYSDITSIPYYFEPKNFNRILIESFKKK